MGFHTFLLEGMNYKPEENDGSKLAFIANKDQNVTPLRIILENCTGEWIVKGLAKENDVFVNRSPRLNLKYKD